MATLPRTTPRAVSRFFGLDPEPGRTPDASEFNDYLASIPPTVEQQREMSVLSDANTRAEAGIRRDLTEAQAVRDARNRGFTGSYPLREQEDEAANQKLKQLLLPKQMELQAEMQNREAQREFTANQNQQDRKLRAQIAQGTQAGQNQRLAARSADIAARQVKLGNNPLRRLLSPFGIMDSNEAVRDKEAQRVRQNVQSQMQGAAGDGGTTIMEDPATGEQVYVPNERVQEYVAKGARIVE